MDQGHIERRRNAINDALVNYLIMIMMEKLELSANRFRIPSSLIVLMREQLCGGPRPDIHVALGSRIKKMIAAEAAARRLQQGEKLTIHKLMDFAAIGQGTAARYLKDSTFQELFKVYQEHVKIDHVVGP